MQIYLKKWKDGEVLRPNILLIMIVCWSQPYNYVLDEKHINFSDWKIKNSIIIILKEKKGWDLISTSVSTSLFASKSDLFPTNAITRFWFPENSDMEKNIMCHVSTIAKQSS